MPFKLIIAGNYFQFKSSYNAIKTNPTKANKTRKHNRYLQETYNLHNHPPGDHVDNEYKKRKDNLSRVRNNFKLLAHANRQQHSKLITLTTKEILTIDQIRQSLHKWLTQLKRDSKQVKLKYIGVYELQERGAPHIHLIFFNNVFINWSKALNHWRTLIGGLGSVQIKQLESNKHINYLTSYLGSCITTLGSKSVIRSIGLEKPKVYKDNIPNHLKTKYLKVEYSRIMGSKQTNNNFENIYGYLSNVAQQFTFDDCKDFLRVSIIRLKAFEDRRSKVPQIVDSR